MVWQSPEAYETNSVAWGDWDNDGDLDLAVGNTDVNGQVNQVFENEGGTLVLDPPNNLGWESVETMHTESVAWGDWDNDGDLDLAVGNGNPFQTPEINQVYENEGGTLVLDPPNNLGWESPEAEATNSVAWGDWDNDGDLDLAVGNGFRGTDGELINRVYENEGGTLVSDPANNLGWESTEAHVTMSVAWGDWDGDGDLDLATGDFPNTASEGRNQIYENESGTLTLDPANDLGWQATEQEPTRQVRWGDWDGDGDLDLAVANSNVRANQVYEKRSCCGNHDPGLEFAGGGRHPKRGLGRCGRGWRPRPGHGQLCFLTLT